MKTISESFVLHGHPDIVEEIIVSETEKVIYTGTFLKLRGKKCPNSCMIKRITVCTEEIDGKPTTTTEIMYAGGCNFGFCYCWADRYTDLNYRFADKKE
jgi:hypothetical protein